MEIHHAHPRGELGWQSGRGDDATNDGLECLFECDSGWSGHRGGGSRSRHARRTMRVRGREEMGWVGPRWGGGVWRGWGAVRVDLPRCAHLTGLSIGVGIGIVGDMMAWMACVLPPGPLLVPSIASCWTPPLHGSNHNGSSHRPAGHAHPGGTLSVPPTTVTTGDHAGHRPSRTI